MAKTHQLATIYPVRTLRERCTALEGALALVGAEPRQKPVHRLRTATRSIEAQLELLCLLEGQEPALRGLRRATRKVRGLLALVRRAAGKVRDLDVQRELIRGSLQEDAGRRARKDAKDLRRALKAEREHAAGELLHELEGHTRRLGPKLEKMLQGLERVQDMHVSGAQVAKLVRGWYDARTTVEEGSKNKLHPVRKAAKLARYMAEGLSDPDNAREYENIQNIGGGWHDSLTLRKVAQDQLGRRSKLVHLLAGHEEAMRAEFRMTLGFGGPNYPESRSV